LLRYDALVISGQDYERYPTQQRVNEKLRSLAAQHPFLFIGYSLSDPDLKQQLRKVLDSQQEMARNHYLVISKIDSLRRKVFDKRNIKVIELGSYDHLEQFLIDLHDESTRQAPPDTPTRPISIQENSDVLALEHDDQRLLTYLEIDYAPVIESLQQLRLKDAEDHLQSILEKVRKAADKEPSLTHMPRLKDFHQRILLALATVAVRRKHYQEARGLYQQSEAIQPFEGKRRLQAAEVLIGLGEFRQVDALLAERVEADETRGKQLLGLATLLQDDEARFRSLYPEGETDNLEFAIQLARLAVESSSHTGIEKALDLLEKAWSLARGFPLGRLVVTQMTDHMLRRILIEEWEAPGIDRQKLLRTIRERYQEVLSTFEALADQYPEGLATTLAQLIMFHGFLGEEGIQHDLLTRLRTLSGMTRDRVLAEHAVEGATPELEIIETLFQQQQLSVGEKALLQGTAFIREGKALEAEKAYRQALAACTESTERSMLIESLLNLMLREERYEEAVAFLEQSVEVGTVFQELMQAMLFTHQKDRERALTILRRALSDHPRNMLLLINLIQLLKRQPEAQATTTSTPTLEEEQTQNYAEALCYAERLEALLPSYWHKLLRAGLLERLERYDDAIQLVEAIEGEGYQTLRIIGLKFSLLQKLGRYREAAEFLAENEARYPDNYALRFNQAVAWAKAGEIEQAIAIWEALRHCPEANGDLYQNLINAQMQLKALDPNAVGHAFDITKEALERFPDRKEFVGFLIQAGEGSGRSREAWEIIALICVRDPISGLFLLTRRSILSSERNKLCGHLRMPTGPVHCPLLPMLSVRRGR
jgi:tetratricopeptide (TPR) repeat protein